MLQQMIEAESERGKGGEGARDALAKDVLALDSDCRRMRCCCCFISLCGSSCSFQLPPESPSAPLSLSLALLVSLTDTSSSFSSPPPFTHRKQYRAS